VYEPRLGVIKELVEKRFNVLNIYYDAGILTFEISDDWIKERFKECILELKKIGYIATAKRSSYGTVLIKVYPYTPPQKSSFKIPVVLVIVTVLTVAVDGFLRSSSELYKVVNVEYGLQQILTQSIIFTISLFSIIFVHEMGHKVSAWIDKVSASPPYFIPGLPGFIPTFGAVIFQKDPLVNRDDMFDIGVSGPIAGFIVAVAVTFVAFETAYWIPLEEYNNVIVEAFEKGAVFYNPPLIFYLVRSLYGNFDTVPFFTSVGFAAWLGMVVTALNLLPIWQLDGGRIFRSFLTRRQHQIASYVSIAILILTGYIFMALLVIMLMSRAPDIVPLDEVSPLSKTRKISIAGILAMLVLSYVPLTTF